VAEKFAWHPRSLGERECDGDFQVEGSSADAGSGPRPGRQPGDTADPVHSVSMRGGWRVWRGVAVWLAFVAAVVIGMGWAQAPAALVAHAAHDAWQQTPAGDSGAGLPVRVVYEDNAIRPENREIVALLRASGAFERLADWVGRRVVLPYGIEIRVTDTLPSGVDVPSTEFDGRTIYYPAFWLAETRDILRDYVQDVLREGSLPSVFPREQFNADDLTVRANQFILGHELGHALIHQLMLPLTGLEEDSADAFALFSTLNSAEGPSATLGAATLFDEMAVRGGELTFEDFSSDHAVVQQRTYNFLCYVVGSDPAGPRHALVLEGYLPALRAMLCPLAWAQLNYGWLTVLEPHFSAGFRAEGTQARALGRERLLAEERALRELIRGPGQ
jgi:hypothetical protein